MDAMQAILEADAEQLIQLIESGDYDPQLMAAECAGETCLHLAAKHGVDDCLLTLLAAGADPLLKDKAARTPLHLSLAHGHVRASTALLMYGADLGDEVAMRDKSSKAGNSSSSRRKCQALDSQGRSPLDMLSPQLSEHLVQAAGTGFGAEVYSFGKADYQLGFEPPNAADVQYARRVGALKHMNAVRIAASRHASMAVTRGGDLYSWGHGKGGRLGHGDEAVQLLPRRVEALAGRIVVDVCAAENHAVAITAEGDVFTWGSNRFHQLGHSSSSAGGGASASACATPKRVEALRRHRVVAAAAGACHTAAVTLAGNVWTWGSNKACQLGHPTLPAGHTSAPRLVGLVGAGAGAVGGSGRRAFAVAAAAHSTLVIAEGVGSSSGGGPPVNEVYQWGHGNANPMRVFFSLQGQAQDDGDDAGWLLPRHSHVNITQVSAAKHHNAALSSAGQVFTWGFGAENLGLGKTPAESRSCSPQLVTAMLPERCGGGIPTYVSATDMHTAVVTSNGDLFTWGAADAPATLGQGGDRFQPVARRVHGVKRALAVATAVDHTVVLLAASVPPPPHCADPAATQAPRRLGPLGRAALRASLPSLHAALYAAEETSNGDASPALSQHSDDEDEEHETAAGLDPHDDTLYSGGYLPVADGSDDSNSGAGSGDAAAGGVLSLKQLCEVILAREVDLKSVPYILAHAHALEAPALTAFCAEYARRNLDAVLVLGGRAAWDLLLDADGAWPRTATQQAQAAELLLRSCEYGSSSSSARPAAATPERSRAAGSGAGSGDSPLPLQYANPAYSPIRHGNGAAAIAAAAVDAAQCAQPEAVASPALRASEAARRARTLRKKLLRLVEQEAAAAGAGTGEQSQEQVARAARRRALELQLDEVLAAEAAALAEQQQCCDASAVCEERIDDFAASAAGLSTKDAALAKEAAPPAAAGRQRCELCGVACDGAAAFEAHLRGRKHQARAASAETQMAGAAVAAPPRQHQQQQRLREQSALEQRSRGDVQQPPPAQQQQQQQQRQQQRRSEAQPPPPSPLLAGGSAGGSSALTTPPLLQRKTVVNSFRSILEEQESAAAATTPAPAAGKPLRTPVIVAAAPPSSTPLPMTVLRKGFVRELAAAQPAPEAPSPLATPAALGKQQQRRSADKAVPPSDAFSLAHYMKSAKPRKAAAAAAAPAADVAPPPPISAWVKPTPLPAAAAAASSPVAAAVSVQAQDASLEAQAEGSCGGAGGARARSFMDILAEEEEERQLREAFGGHENKWFIARKPRSASLGQIQEQQAREAEALAAAEAAAAVAAAAAAAARQEEEDVALAIQLSLNRHTAGDGAVSGGRSGGQRGGKGRGRGGRRQGQMGGTGEAGIVSANGHIRAMMEETVSGMTVGDRLRDALVNPDSDDAHAFDKGKKAELLYHVFKALVLGGAMCQPEDRLEPYLDATKRLYKDMVCVFRAKDDPAIQVASHAFIINAVEWTSAGLRLFEVDSPHNVCLVVVTPRKGQVVMLHKTFRPYW
ncbi:hypothetical protein JKP88DRAFT_352879 [Tribonema minus]|uniref:C2H2-type domain-containing protein n=1 Tax=Tribonema minus TaxID=303371 RepID=A0A835ZA25_9STRA|nr:hypothetical protein JKP88DRAFT_352879 [Tribonema minus]